ncbi:FliH/SctL family protein [Nocardioides bruguierae]|uniref:FliH/SctL family protein n=1 Tax=Nocardioides bruguierae TaxID=2945102 RepID=A0A9X2DBD1_9ACTN|nr:FliH/SctL family protein [Nocardioides bruguierae]MCM0622565.1 FliH/SctL family protein [Nocardioides bruguierae]
MTSSTEPAGYHRVLRGAGAAGADALRTPELRSGEWTRFTDEAALGDRVAEDILGSLAGDVREAARAQGYAIGWGEGRRAAAAEHQRVVAELAQAADEAEQRRAAEHRSAVLALAAAARRLDEELAARVVQVEEQSLGLAHELTALLVGHELAVAEDPTGDLVRRALTLQPVGSPVTLRLAPGQLAPEHRALLAEAGVGVTEDHALAPGDALVESPRQVIDLRISTALERIREALS